MYLPIARFFACIGLLILPFGCAKVETAKPEAEATAEELLDVIDPTRIYETPAGSKWASTTFHGGDQQTRQFLTWARNLYAVYCEVVLDDRGACIEILVHPCWDVKHEEFKVISELPKLEKLCCSSSSITDADLRYFEKMPALKSLRIVSTKNITDEGLARLQAAKPHLEIVLPLRDYDPLAAKTEQRNSISDE